jgi:hypothetical protein
VENQTQVFHASHSPLKIPQTRQDFHISTAPMMTVFISNQKTKKNQRKEVGRYAASSFPIPLCPRSSRTDFMLIFQLENARGPSSRHAVVIGMRANPEPEDAIFNLSSQRPVMEADPDRPENIDLLEAQRWVVGVRLQ